MILTPDQMQHVTNTAATALLNYCMQWNIHATVTGVSGGLDSAVTLALAKKASELGKKKGFALRTIGLILPCQSDPEHAQLGKKVIEKFGAELIEMDLTGMFERIEEKLLGPLRFALSGLSAQSGHGARLRAKRGGGRAMGASLSAPRWGARGERRAIEVDPKQLTIAHGNIKARLRMALGTYYVANLTNGIVLSTDNYSEYWMGFWTLHGDVGDFGLIQELWKGDELPAIAKYLGVPNEVIEAVPTDGLGVHPGGDEGQLGAPYKTVDHIVRTLQKKGIDLNGSLEQLNRLPDIPGIDPAIVKKIAERGLRNSFKRRGPVGVKRTQLGLNE